SFLDVVERNESAQQQLQQQLLEAPKQISDAQQALQKLLSTVQDDPAKRLALASVSELELLLSERNQELQALQKELGEANSLIVTAQTRPERAQAEISTNQTRIQEINTLLKNAKEGSKIFSSEKTDALKAELLSL